MPRALVVARLRIPESDLPATRLYYEGLSPALRDVPGFLGLAIYRSTAYREEFLALYGYENQATADLGLEAMVRHRLHAESVALASPPDVVRIEVTGRMGVRMVNPPDPAYLSLSHRSADPGYGPEMCEELERIFTEISPIPGFLGATYGFREDLPDECYGLALWSTPTAFYDSVPPGTIYDIRLYEAWVRG